MLVPAAGAGAGVGCSAVGQRRSEGSRGGRGAVRGGGGWKEVTGCGSGDAAAGSCRSKDGVGSHLPTPGGDLGTEQDPK